MDIKNPDDIRKNVLTNYGQVAKSDGSGCGCSPTGCCGDEGLLPSAQERSILLGYSDQEVNDVPDGANMGLGCGNPQAIAALQSGETVVDLGSGGGFDCFLAARQVGPGGRIIGVDMTPEMIHKARQNCETGGYRNVEFRLGEIEHLPIADNTADVILSNCVINLSPQKDKVFADAFRVLKPGGRLAIADIVATADIPESLLSDPELYCGCASGAARIETIQSLLDQAGFVDVQVKTKEESRDVIKEWFPGTDVENYVVSADIEAVKPA